MHIMLSIIVPVYNVETYLIKCIDSILAQTFKKFELILVDDGSLDQSGNICDQYAKLDQRIKVIHKENEGPMAACIDGIRRAEGLYIGFVDSDDWVEPEMYLVMCEKMEIYNADVVQCGFFNESKSRKVFCKSKGTDIYDKNDIGNYIISGLLNWWQEGENIFLPNRWSKIFRKELLKKNLEYYDMRIRFGEDLNMVLPCVLDAKKIVCLDNVFYHYRFNESSIINSYKENFVENNLILYKQLICIATMKKTDIKDKINIYYDYILMSAIYNEGRSRHSFFMKYKNVKEICEKYVIRDFLNFKYYKKIGKSIKLILLLSKCRAYFLLAVLIELLVYYRKFVFRKNKD